MTPNPNSSGETPNFKWYILVSNSEPLEQGDLLNGFPIVIPPVSLAGIAGEAKSQVLVVDATVEEFNVVVMTQSCDLIKLHNEDYVILCPRHDLRDAKSHGGARLDNEVEWDRLVKGAYVSRHLINRCDIEGHHFDYQVVDLQRIFTVPLAVVKQVALQQGVRVRLLPPYREHLAQAFARQFMRVGLPVDLPRRYPRQR